MHLNNYNRTQTNTIAWLDVDVEPVVEHPDELLEENPFSVVDVQEEEEELEVDEEAVQCFQEAGEKLVLPLVD